MDRNVPDTPEERRAVGPYTLLEKLGEGAFGSVWLAEKRTPVANLRVALKLPGSQSVDMEAIRNEAKVWASAAGHPNVLPIVDADVFGDTVAIASEYAPSGSLSEWLTQHGGAAPSVASATEMANGILAGAEHLHGLDIVHRDIKPANILLQGLTPRLADFGLSRILRDVRDSWSISGTPAYMAPESFDGERTKQTDIWSVGVVFYEMLTGQLPFAQTQFRELKRAITTQEHTPLPQSVPERIRSVVGKALEKDPDRRFGFAQEMREELQTLLNNVESYGVGGVMELPDSNLGRDIRVGGFYFDRPMRIMAGSWIKFYDTGWSRSGWLYSSERDPQHAEDFFKIHLLKNGRGYIHFLCSADPRHTLWFDSGIGGRAEFEVSWSGHEERSLVHFFNWK